MSSEQESISFLEVVSLDALKGILTSKEKLEDKIQAILFFMKRCLSQDGFPLFKEFWDARKEILLLFKENLPPYLRAQLWKEFTELTYEAKKVRDILDERSLFHVEQIELAIQAVEK